MSNEEIWTLICYTSAWVSAKEDEDFIDSHRYVQYHDKYLESAPKILEALELLWEKVHDRS